MNTIDPAAPELASLAADTKTVAPKRNRASWTRHITDWSGSENSLNAYCQQQNLSVDRFTFWQRKLAREQATHTPRFVPVSVRGAGLPATGAVVNLTLPNGIVISLQHLDSAQPVMDLVSGLMRV